MFCMTDDAAHDPSAGEGGREQDKEEEEGRKETREREEERDSREVIFFLLL